MKKITRVLAALAFSGWAGMAQASLIYSFSFENVLNGGGSVTGLIHGLNEGTGAASSVEVLSNSLGFGLGEYVGLPTFNVWTVTGGVITAFDFLSFGINNSFPDETDSTLFFDSIIQAGASFRAGLSNLPNSVTTGDSTLSSEDISLNFVQVPVPAPATLPLLALGLAAIVFSCRKRNLQS